MSAQDIVEKYIAEYGPYFPPPERFEDRLDRLKDAIEKGILPAGTTSPKFLIYFRKAGYVSKSPIDPNRGDMVFTKREEEPSE